MKVIVMPDKDQIWMWVTGGLVVGNVGLIAFIIRGAKGYVEDVAKRCKIDSQALKVEVNKLALKQEDFVRKEYMRDDIKPVLEKFDKKLDSIKETMITREEHKHDIEALHNKVNKKQDKI